VHLAKEDVGSFNKNQSNKSRQFHCSFIFYEYLSHSITSKVREYPNVTVLLVDESYTSKTCGRCGTLNRRLGGSKQYHCVNSNCGWSCRRDVNGARNILLKFLTEQEQC
jgi:transposase